MKYLLLIIIIIVSISLLALFEKPAVNQYSGVRDNLVTIEGGGPPKDVQKKSGPIYSQKDMDFLKAAYGVGGS